MKRVRLAAFLIGLIGALPISVSASSKAPSHPSGHRWEARVDYGTEDGRAYRKVDAELNQAYRRLLSSSPPATRAMLGGGKWWMTDVLRDHRPGSEFAQIIVTDDGFLLTGDRGFTLGDKFTRQPAPVSVRTELNDEWNSLDALVLARDQLIRERSGWGKAGEVVADVLTAISRSQRCNQRPCTMGGRDCWPNGQVSWVHRRAIAAGQTGGY